jgi:thymidylate synthase ThyX
MYAAKVLADSIAHGVRLKTLEITFPRIVLAEFNTHRVFSRNSASSRAIPVEKRIAAVRANPFIPAAFASNKKGMQAGENLSDVENSDARLDWEEACEAAIASAESLARLGVHKHWANRLIEPFSWHTVIVTATEWDNFFALRCNEMAAPEIHTVADLMKTVMDASTPHDVANGGWHLPFIKLEDWSEFAAGDENFNKDMLHLAKLSAARCARVSYLTHDGKRDVAADLALYDRLASSGHMSPFEHPAMVSLKKNDHRAFIGNFRAPWKQLRKMLPGEAVFGR